MKPYIVLIIVLTISSSFYNAHAGFSAELIHRDSPKSPFFNPAETPYERIQKSINRSIARANHIGSTINQQIDPNDPKLNAEDHGFEYLMTLSLGTPPVQVTGLMDTGSNILWTQCAPCANCYEQTAPLFDPSKSSTYRKMPCDASECKLAPGSKCDDGTCSYEITYGGGQTSSAGQMGFDTFTVGTVSGGQLAFTGGFIGCGSNSHGPVLEGPVSGIFGLGPGPVSILQQMGDHAGGKFSYCLIPVGKISDRYSIIHFGNSAIIPGPGIVSTPLGFDKHYWVTLDAVTVGATTIQNPKKESPEGSGNIMVDSGTAVTFVDPNMYSEIVGAFKGQIDVGPEEESERLCYRGEFTAPPVTIHFKGADVNLGKENTFMNVEEDLMCLAFRAIKNKAGIAIYGSFMQMDFWVEYDLRNGVMSFSQQVDCTQEV